MWPRLTKRSRSMMWSPFLMQLSSMMPEFACPKTLMPTSTCHDGQVPPCWTCHRAWWEVEEAGRTWSQASGSNAGLDSLASCQFDQGAAPACPFPGSEAWETQGPRSAVCDSWTGLQASCEPRSTTTSIPWQVFPPWKGLCCSGWSRLWWAWGPRRGLLWVWWELRRWWP